MHLRTNFFYSLLILFSTIHCRAQQIDSELSDQSNAAIPIDHHDLQVEFAYQVTRFNEEKIDALTPITWIRYGLINKMELGIFIEEGKYRDHYMEKSTQANFPLALTGKFNLLRKGDETAGLSLITMLQLPFTLRGDEAQAYWSPFFALAAEHKLSETLRLTANSGMSQQPFSSQWQIPVNTSLAFAPSEVMTFIVNYFAQLQFKDEPQHNLGGAIQFQLNPLLAVFLSGGSTINPQDPNFYFAAGFAFNQNMKRTK